LRELLFPGLRVVAGNLGYRLAQAVANAVMAAAGASFHPVLRRAHASAAAGLCPLLMRRSRKHANPC
jgi:hypothetical protein